MKFRRFRHEWCMGMLALACAGEASAFERDVAGVFGPRLSDGVRSRIQASGHGRGSPVPNPFLHQGLPRDAEKNSYQNRHREYAANCSRFVERDPSEYFDGLNTYAYVRNTPASLTDANGLVGGSGANDGYCRIKWRWEPVLWFGHIGIEFAIIRPNYGGIRHSLDYGDSRYSDPFCGRSNCKGNDGNIKRTELEDPQTVDSCWCNCFASSVRAYPEQRSRYGDKCKYGFPPQNGFPCWWDPFGRVASNSNSGIHAAWLLCRRECVDRQHKAEFRLAFFCNEPRAPGWWVAYQGFQDDCHCNDEHFTWGGCVDH